MANFLVLSDDQRFDIDGIAYVADDEHALNGCKLVMLKGSPIPIENASKHGVRQRIHTQLSAAE